MSQGLELSLNKLPLKRLNEPEKRLLQHSNQDLNNRNTELQTIVEKDDLEAGDDFASWRARAIRSLPWLANKDRLSKHVRQNGNVQDGDANNDDNGPCYTTQWLTNTNIDVCDHTSNTVRDLKKTIEERDKTIFGIIDSLPADILHRSSAFRTYRQQNEHQDLEIRTLKRENDELKNLTACAICLHEKRSVVINPCSHLLCCERCAPRVVNEFKKCSICSGNVSGSVKIYW